MEDDTEMIKRMQEQAASLRHLDKLRCSRSYRVPLGDSNIWLPRQIGRNDPCPCGSGQKYKKCCKP